MPENIPENMPEQAQAHQKDDESTQMMSFSVVLHDYRTFMMCPDEWKDRCNQLFRILPNEFGVPYDMGPAPGFTMSAPASPTGQAPATHWWGDTWELPDYPDKLTQLKNGTHPIFSGQTDWSEYGFANVGDARQAAEQIYFHTEQWDGSENTFDIIDRVRAAGLAEFGLTTIYEEW